jgi:hypothetical protein
VPHVVDRVDIDACERAARAAAWWVIVIHVVLQCIMSFEDANVSKNDGCSNDPRGRKEERCKLPQRSLPMRVRSWRSSACRLPAQERKGKRTPKARTWSSFQVVADIRIQRAIPKRLRVAEGVLVGQLLPGGVGPRPLRSVPCLGWQLDVPTKGSGAWMGARFRHAQVCRGVREAQVRAWEHEEDRLAACT